MAGCHTTEVDPCTLHLDDVHVCDPELAIIASTGTHHGEALEVLAAQSPTPHHEDLHVPHTGHEVLAKDSDLVVVARPHRRAGVAGNSVSDQGHVLMVHPLLDGGELASLLDHLSWGPQDGMHFTPDPTTQCPRGSDVLFSVPVL